MSDSVERWMAYVYHPKSTEVRVELFSTLVHLDRYLRAFGPALEVKHIETEVEIEE